MGFESRVGFCSKINMAEKKKKKRTAPWDVSFKSGFPKGIPQLLQMSCTVNDKSLAIKLIVAQRGKL